VWKKNIEIVQILCNNNADVNFKNRNYELPLKIACKKGCPAEIAEILCFHGADVNN